MGHMADYEVQKFFFGRGYSKPRRRGYQRGSGEGKWRTPEGVISMTDMTPEHLENALKMCEQKNNTGKAEQLRAEISRREEMASKPGMSPNI